MTNRSNPINEAAATGPTSVPKRRRSSARATSYSYNSDPDRDDSGDEEDSSNGMRAAASVTLSDLDVLDCKICSEPLTIPVYQCVNGHTACSQCCTRLKNKCASCCRKTGKNRCRAIEEVLESVKTTCCYQDYGCKAVIAYCRKQKHEKTCSFAPFMCPFSRCGFRGSTPKLSHHMGTEHSDSVVSFTFNCLFPVSSAWNYNKIGEFIVLQEQSKGVRFVIERDDGALNVGCVELRPDEGSYQYDLIIRNHSGSLRVQSSTKCVGGQIGDPRASNCFRLPPGLFSSDDDIVLVIWDKSIPRPDICAGI